MNGVTETLTAEILRATLRSRLASQHHRETDTVFIDELGSLPRECQDRHRGSKRSASWVRNQIGSGQSSAAKQPGCSVQQSV